MNRAVGALVVIVGLSVMSACASGTSADGPSISTQQSSPSDAASSTADVSTAQPDMTSSQTSESEQSTEPKVGTIDTTQSVASEKVELSSDQQAALREVSEGKLIGIICATMTTEYHANLCNSAKKTAEQLGFKAEIFDAQENPDRELQGFESFVSKGVYAILEDSLGGDAIVNQVAQATKAGIVVVQLSSRSFSTEGAITVSVDDAEIARAEGEAAGKYAAENFSGTTVQVAVTDYPSIPSLVERADGIVEAFKDAYSDINVVGRFLGGTAENGQKSIESALQQFPNIQAVVGINDAGNLGAYQALKAAGHTADDTFIFGIDCDPQAVDLIKQGTMYKGCVDTNPSGTGAVAANAVGLYALGESVPGNISVPVTVFDGK